MGPSLIVAPSPSSLSGAGSGVEGSPISDAVAALVALGYRPPDADKAVRKALAALGSEATTEALIRKALA